MVDIFEVYMDNNPLTYILTTATLDVTRKRLVASLANYNFKIFYRSGKLNVEADALSSIPWENTQVNHLEPLIVNTMSQSKLETEIGIPEEYAQLNVVQKEIHHEDSDIGSVIQLLKSDKVGKYVAKEMDSSGMQILLKYRKDLFLKNGLLY